MLSTRHFVRAAHRVLESAASRLAAIFFCAALFGLSSTCSITLADPLYLSLTPTTLNFSSPQDDMQVVAVSTNAVALGPLANDVGSCQRIASFTWASNLYRTALDQPFQATLNVSPVGPGQCRARLYFNSSVWGVISVVVGNSTSTAPSASPTSATAIQSPGAVATPSASRIVPGGKYNSCSHSYFDTSALKSLTIFNSCAVALGYEYCSRAQDNDCDYGQAGAGTTITTRYAENAPDSAAGFWIYACPIGYAIVDGAGNPITAANREYECKAQ